MGSRLKEPAQMFCVFHFGYTDLHQHIVRSYCQGWSSKTLLMWDQLDENVFVLELTCIFSVTVVAAGA